MDKTKFDFYISLLKTRFEVQKIIDIIEEEEKAEGKENNEPIITRSL